MHNANDFQKNLRLHSSTFYFASLWLPSEIRKQVAKLYYFCRYLDDLADKPGKDNQEEILNIYADIKDDKQTHPISQHIQSIMKTYGIPNSVPLSLINGINKDFNDVQILSKKELLNYAYEVAGTVGIMMAHMLGVQSQMAQHHAIDLSIAMQLTNIARDIYEDAILGRRYLPSHWVNHLSPKDILSPSSSQTIQINRAMSQIIELSEAYYLSGIAGIQYLPKKYQAAIFRAAKLYQAIGHTLESAEKPFQNKKIKPNAFKKASILLNSYQPCSNQVQHKVDLHLDINHLPYTHAID